MPADCLEKVLKSLFVSKGFLITTSTTPKIILKDACQVQQADCRQRVHSTGKLLADEGKKEPEIDSESKVVHMLQLSKKKTIEND